MHTVIFYTIHCPACNVLKKKLDAKGIQYEEVTDRDLMIAKGFSSMPMLEIDGQVLNYADARKWVDAL